MGWDRDNRGRRSRQGSGFGDSSGFEEPAFEPRRRSGSGYQAAADSSAQMATVKWFNASKGFGFVSPADGSPDAFMHVSVLERAGHQAPPDGAMIVCDFGPGQRGPQVVAIHSVDTSTATPGNRPASRTDHSRSRPSSGEQTDGTVKFFSPDKGFGFVASDAGGKDVFVHIKVLERSGVAILESEQRVRMMVSMGVKGPQAESIELI